MNRQHPLHRSLFAAGLAALLAITFWAFHARLLEAAANWLDVGVRPQPADYVMILNGGENERPFAAAALMKMHLARHVLITECAPTPTVLEHLIPPYHEVGRLILIQRGVPARDITILPAQAKTTFDEARALAAFLADKPDVHVLLLTNDYHTRRSRWVFAHVLGDQMRQLTVVSAPSEGAPPDCWWKTTDGIMFVPIEYLKLLFYVFYYDQSKTLAIWLGTLAFLAILVLAARRSLKKRATDDSAAENAASI